MVDEYRRLRQRDSGSTTSSWRITVRQLESMIRLSEGMARLHCQDEVQPKHVKEAFRLLNKSIIRVEQPVINFEEEEDDGPQLDEDTATPVEAMETDTPPTQEQTTQDSAAPSPSKKKGLHMSFEEYKMTSNLLVIYMRQQEEKEGGCFVTSM